MARERRRRATLTARGRVLAVLGAGLAIAAYPTGRVELLSLGLFLGAIPVWGWVWARLTSAELRVARAFLPATAVVGQALEVRVTVANRGAGPSAHARVSDAVPWPPFLTAATVLLPIRSGRAATLGYTLYPPQRGVIPVGPLLVETVDPFGVARSRAEVGSAQEVTVVPRLDPLPRVLHPGGDEGGSLVTRQRSRQGGMDDQLTRDYRAGDPLRRVHWRATARTGQLMVRQEEQHARRSAFVILDTQERGYRDIGHATPMKPRSETFEWALRFAATVAVHLVEDDFTVSLHETGVGQLPAPARSIDFLESLAVADLVPAGPVELEGAAGLAIAIASAPTAETLRLLARARERASAGLAVLVSAHADGTAANRTDALAAALRDAGWVTITAGPRDGAAAVWSAAGQALALLGGDRRGAR